MALWVWRFVEGDPPHFFHASSIYWVRGRDQKPLAFGEKPNLVGT